MNMNINIMNLSTLFSDKNSNQAKPTSILEKSNQHFSEILNNEKKNIVHKRQDTLNRSVRNTNTINTDGKKTMNSLDGSSGASTSEMDILNQNASSRKSFSLETTKPGKNEDVSDPVETLDHEILHEIALLIQHLFTNVSMDTALVESGNKLNISSPELKDLVNLKDQLNLVASTMSITVNESTQNTIKGVLSILTNITDNLMEKYGSLSSIEDLDIISSSVVELKNFIELTINDNASTGSSIFKKLNMQKESTLVNREEEHSSEYDTTLSNDMEMGKETGTRVNKSDVLLTSSNNEEHLLVNQHESNENITPNNALLLLQQKVDETINVNVAKGEIVQPKQFINLIAQKASTFLSKDKNEMSIQLAPENLGKISIKIGLNDGSLTGKIYAENYSVKEIIESNLNQLRDALEERGLNISGLEVNVGDNPQSFGSGFFKQRTTRSQITKGISQENNNGFLTLEEDTIQKNPYLVTGQFDGRA